MHEPEIPTPPRNGKPILKWFWEVFWFSYAVETPLTRFCMLVMPLFFLFSIGFNVWLLYEGRWVSSYAAYFGLD